MGEWDIQTTGYKRLKDVLYNRGNIANVLQ